MRLRSNSKWLAKATNFAIAILILSAFGGALQTAPLAPSDPGSIGLPNRCCTTGPEFAKATVRWVLVSISDRKLALVENGKAIRTYRIAVGKASTPSPTGKFRIINRITDPRYYHNGLVVPAGSNNPVGSRWMGLSARGYGIHGTNQPNSIGQAASTGCIRMGKQDVEELFGLLAVGDTVQIRAERDEEIAAIFGERVEGTSAGAQPRDLLPAESSSGGGQ